MPNPVIISPTLTLAGQAAALNASNNGLELKISHVSYGIGHYNPTGNEVALASPRGNKVPVAGAARPTPYQIRLISSWREDVGDVPIGEIAFWAGEVLVFVWSKADGTILSRKTNGVSYVLFCDLAFSAAPANSISFVIDPTESIALAALAVHESAYGAHPQYVLHAKFPDYQGYLWGITSGSANAIKLKLPDLVELTEYSQGNRFTFKALFDNTGDTSIAVNTAGPVQVLKTGGVPLTPGSIIAGGVYDILYDGGSFQLTAGAGFASAEATTAEVTTTTSVNSTSWVSVRRLIQALALKANWATTLSGYGIADAYTKPQVDGIVAAKANWAITLAGYGIGDAYTKTATDGLLAGKANWGSTLAAYGIGDAYTQATVNAMLAGLWNDGNATPKAIVAQASAEAGAVGTYALLLIGGGVSSDFDPMYQGALIAGASCAFTNAKGETSGGAPTGTWKLMGMVFNHDGTSPDSATLCLRVS